MSSLHDNNVFASPDQLIQLARNGRMFILVDDEDRENEGDLVIPAQMATPDAINFMARHGRGLICLALTKDRADALGLQPMVNNNRSRNETAFTVSIEAREGISTGISAADRAHTIALAIDSSHDKDSLVSPGHVFPLVARPGGVLVRAGHTEAGVDIARLAGLNPSAVICEVMRDDGTMARLDDLTVFARTHGLKIGMIRDLIAYRRRYDHLVERVGDSPFVTEYGGEWRLLCYRNTIDGSEDYVLQKGAIDPHSPTLVRVHHASLFTDVLGAPGPRARLLQRAMLEIAQAGAGVIVLFPRPDDAMRGLRPWNAEADQEHVLRTLGIGAQILADLDVHDMILLTDSPHRVLKGLEAYGVNIVGERGFSLPAPVS